jgi:poly-D-alanine transfer protein DltD
VSEKDHVAGLAIQIPGEMLNQVIVAEIAKALPDRDLMIERVVRSAINQKVDHYGKKTKFESEVEKMIRETAQNIMSEWIDQNREGIREAFFMAMNRQKGKKLKDLAEKMADGLASVYVRNITIDIDDKK